MTWFKVDDGLPTHAKTDALGDDQAIAVACWTLCGAACARDLTDGRVTRAALRRTLALWDPADQQRAVAALVRVGLWVADDAGWLFHEWLEHQPSREDVLAERARKAANQRAARDRKRDAAAKAVTGDMPGDVTGDKTVSHHGPTRPDPTRPTTYVVGESDDDEPTQTHSTIPRGPSARKAYADAVQRAGGIFDGGGAYRDCWRKVESLATAAAERGGGNPQALLDTWATRYVTERKSRTPKWWLERVEAWASEGTAPPAANTEPSDDAIQRMERRLAAQRLARAGGAS